MDGIGAYEAADRVLHRLEQAGYQAFLVGGCVRDRLLGREPADYDVATDAVPQAVQALFARTAATGWKHGTVTVLHGEQGTEVTTFRKEEGYTDFRRPDRVVYVKDLRTDLSRRDFTMNAMAEDRRGRLYDPFEGERDLAVGRIRTVGPAPRRFREDALRAVRAARFVAQLGFDIEAETEAALSAVQPLLRKLSVERVTAEIEKMWETSAPSSAFAILWRRCLLHGLPPFYRWEFLPRKPIFPLKCLDEGATPEERWALLLFQCGVKPEEVIRKLREFRLPGRTVSEAGAICRTAADWPPFLPEERGKRLILDRGEETVRKAGRVARWIHGWTEEEQRTVDDRLRRWADEMPVKELEDLQLDGGALIRAMGRSPGPWVGRVLRRLLVKAALGKVSNESGQLLREGCRIGKSDT
ncbi:CCA tRNA nucleotidyltransferase [Paludifilum halophilum]|uniref:CCA tRNA nucleotidyltransferase n=1 Tax=Paludifilum halophilum TaxID=1642702 RepID=A0A235BBJ8_9BACL|nr:CCA tRNA nucleotidyltransferase [Paludifilum halophilum]OYD09688.1 CCA tRNA nucleotidyltransferase [Paludifilum halophilum]